MQESTKNTKSTKSALRYKSALDVQCMREKSRDSVRAHKRLVDLEAEIKSDVSLCQVKGLILELSQKKKKFDIEILKKIKNSCCHPSFIEAFFKINGAFDSLINLLKSRDAQIQLEAVACFSNLACGPHKLCFRVAKSVGAYLVSFLTGSSHYLQAQSAWAIRNIANDCADCYTRLKSQGVFPALSKALTSPMPDVIESVVYGLSACLKHGDLDLVDINGDKYTSFLLKLIDEESLPFNAVREAAFALSSSLYIAINANHECKNIDLLQLLHTLKRLLINENNDYLTALILIRCLGYLTVYDWVAEFLYICDEFHEIAIEILNQSSHFLKKELLWVLTNISVTQAMSTDHSLFLPTLKGIEIFLNPLDSGVFSVLYYVSCMANQNENVKSLCHEYGIISRIQNLTSCGSSDVENASRMCIAIIQNQSI